MDRILSWNVRGINNKQKQKLVRHLINSQKVSLVGLLKTRVKARKLGSLYVNIFNGWCFTSNIAWHAGGRIIVAWNPLNFTVIILRCTSQLMHLLVSTVDGKNRFYVTFVYAVNDTDGRKVLWRDLQDINTQEAWVVMGDFNEILTREERIGKRVKYSIATDFIDYIGNCQLEDVKYSGSFFTWSNKQQGDDRICSKIDRVLANQTWLNRFINAKAVFLFEGIFDHTPAVLSVYPEILSGKKPFKYFRMWSSHPKYSESVKEVWQRAINGTKMFQVVAKLKALKGVLKELNKQGEVEARDKYIQVHNELNSFLQQKAKLSWIKDGDDNIAIFHTSIRERRRQNRILSIETREGIRVEEPSQVTDAFLSFYQSLLGQILKEFNTTVLTLIPKVKCPNTVSDFRLIACCNVIYKTTTKLICSRLKHILPELVAQNQGGFIKGRFIAHNIMICQDLIRHYGRKETKAGCVIKLDLQKAYDTIEWNFLEELLLAFQFPDKFVKLVMNCVRTPRFSLMFNGSMHGYFEAKRGLRQGDPMSPLLFVLEMEYFSRIIQRIGTKSDFKFHDRCEVLKLNHLSFADDVIMFCHGDFKSIHYLLQGLKLFSFSSGLHPNPSKSAIYCCGMQDSEVQRIVEASGFCRKEVPFKYLGIPVCAKRISIKDCSVLADKMTARIKAWSTRNLSFAGRAVLINSVLLTIHSY
ncbi:uncharacterized protein LOC133785572 [Humulus lupulus]|uniref:uncharacterized protein LOC133785572 n=1 Tax=Humulus lupulus TaxID=3486 RepID=UPI002B415438|nr:uncharacterized protein LOC133785572 [Humulus lupulus]